MCARITQAASFIMSLLLFLSFGIFLSNAHPLSRYNRQTMTDALGTGLTGSGTSFYPAYDSQSTVETYSNYQFPQQTLDTYPVSGHSGYEDYNSYGPEYYNQPKGAVAAPVEPWGGFGMGKNGYVARSQYNYGVKY